MDIILLIFFIIFIIILILLQYLAQYWLMKYNINSIILSLKKYKYKSEINSNIIFIDICNIQSTKIRTFLNPSCCPDAHTVVNYICKKYNLSLADKLYKFIIITLYYYKLSNYKIPYIWTNYFWYFIEFNILIDENLKKILNIYYDTILFRDLKDLKDLNDANDKINQIFSNLFYKYSIYSKYCYYAHNNIFIKNYEYIYLQFYNNTKYGFIKLYQSNQNFIDNNEYNIINYFDKHKYSELRHLWISLVGLSNARYILWNKVR